MQNALTPREKRETLRSLLLTNKDAIQESMPKFLSAERFIGQLFTSINLNPDLLNCTPRSLIGALLYCGSLGLEPGPLGHIYIIPYGNQAQVVPGYKGLIQLARRSELLDSIDAGIVFRGDEFEFNLGVNPMLHYRPNPDRKEFGNKDDVQWCWALHRIKGCDVPQLTVISHNRIEWHRNRYSKAKNKGPWVDNWPEMGMKTAIRMNLKFSPMRTECQSAIAIDEMAENQLSQAEFFPEIPKELEENMNSQLGESEDSQGPAEVAGPSPIAPPWAPKALAGKPLNQLKKPQLKALLDLVSKRIQQDKANDDPNNAFVAKDKALKQDLEGHIQGIRDQEKETADTVPSKPQQDPVVEAAKEAKAEPPVKPEPKQAEAQTADDDAAKLSLKEEASLLCDQLKSMPNGALRLIEVMDSLRIHTLRSATEAEIPPFIDALIKEITKGEAHAASEN